ncbi:hypothetical protein [Streptomyces lomondensis]|uniref:DUF3558 domain-containing protein n=1 Tax=Streptomyces lomondensis TaxID=68229 RepID=A0ABQ2WZF0_9ACTN|nr:hypothetical protein [Streptomyces lomondensis]MCF0082018.1 DUF3558 domain-containing protein [Streptomyces lomondensis]GGW85447.1 hypothetical protein GCM10010383_13150 [Streptomyces lomondensis]
MNGTNRRGRTSVVVSAVSALSLFAAGCSAQDNASPGASPTVSAGSGRPTPSAVSLSVTPEELRGSDPCRLIDEKVLAEFGKTEYDQGNGYGECDIRLDGPDDQSVSVFVELQAAASDTAPDDPPPTPVLRDGVTVYESEDRGDLTGSVNCTRDVVLRERTATVAIGVYGDESGSRACPIADAAAGDVIRLLKTGDLPSARHAPDSLANQDACDLLKKSEAARVPDIDPGKRYDTFTGQSCSWGAESIDEPHLYVLFLHLDEALEGRPLTVGGRTAAVQYSPADEYGDLLGRSLPNCAVEVEYGKAGPTAEGRTEVVSVGVTGDSPRDVLCSLAQELAPKALARLPGP